MSRNGSGTYSLPAGNPVVTGTTISSTWANSTLSDIATALTQSIAYDGQTTPIANLPMGGYVHTGVGNATARTNYASAAQVEDGTLNYLTTVAGTNTITATAPLSMAAYVAGQTFRFIAAGANTGAVTLNLNAIGAKSVVRTDGSALSSGDIASGSAVVVMYDGTNFQLLTDSNGKTETVTNLTVTGNLTNSALTAGRVTYATTGGLLTDSANLVFDGSNLGVGTASPSARLTLKTASDGAAINAVTGFSLYRSANDTRLTMGYSTTADAFVISSTYDTTGAFKPLAFATSDAERMRLDTSGNLGLGVTPSAWSGANRSAIQLAGNAAIQGSNAIGLSLYENAYFNGTNDIFSANGSAYKHEIGTGYIWKYAGGGTAGGTVTWTSQMTLDTAGKLTVIGDASINGLTVGKGGGAASENTSLGVSALAATNTGNDNTGIGYYSLLSNTGGAQNTSVGAFAMRVNTTGSENSAYGYIALRNNTTGNYNTGIGNQALYSNTTASGNTAVGYQAAYTTSTGEVTAFGYQAAKLATGDYNTAIGNSALLNTSTGTANTGVGRSALYSNTTGAYNVALGKDALASNTTASNNTAVGYQAGYSATTQHDCTLVGYQAGYSLSTTGYLNDCFGVQAGYSITTGRNNVCLGNNSAQSLATGNQNIHIGYTLASSSSVSNEIVIGYNVTGKGANTGFIYTSSGMYQGNNSTLWSITSDQRLKKNIVDNTVGLEKICAIQVRNFEYRLPDEVTELDPVNAINIKGVQLGAIAQELQQVLPDCVKEESTGVLSVDASNITWYLINAIKELKAEIDALKAK